MVTGKNVTIGRHCVVLPPEFIKLGNNISIGRGFHLETNLIVGNDVLISSYVSIVGNDHKFSDQNNTVYYSGRTIPAKVVLEGDNLIGHRVIIVGSVRIGRGCIVGAGAVVTKDLPPYTVCYGIPAKPARNRFPSNAQ